MSDEKKASLATKLKDMPLETDIGTFTYVKQIGQGGNATVFSFKKGESPFVIKFLEHGDEGKMARFKDEFFCAMQIATHKNIARAYHFDTVKLGRKCYSLILMKQYKESLANKKHIAASPDEERAELGWKLLVDLARGLAHLHRNGIIHRDIKPENIFYDEANDAYVIGDLGIAHFFEDVFVREAETKKGERLANFKFSAPEQVEGKGSPNPAWDIYAMGQVISWYLYDELVRGPGRTRYTGSNENLSMIDAVIDRCLQNNPTKRFAAVEDISQFVKNLKEPKRDIFDRFRDLDATLRMSFPTIERLYETTDAALIERFIKNFSAKCQANEFWYIKSDGGDMSLSGLTMTADGRCLLSGYYELKVEKLICYKHPGHWRSFFILLAAADSPFDIVDFDGRPAPRPDMTKWSSDVAVLYDQKYIDPRIAENGFYERNGQTHEIDPKKMYERERILKPDAFMIVPHGTGPNAVRRDVNEDFLSKVLTAKSVDQPSVNAYLEETLPYVSPEVIARL